MANDAYRPPLELKLEESTDECVDSSYLCLIRKILTSKALNKQVVTRIILGVWKTRAEITISSWPENVFLFRFGSEEDRALVLQNAPCNSCKFVSREEGRQSRYGPELRTGNSQALASGEKTQGTIDEAPPSTTTTEASCPQPPPLLHSQGTETPVMQQSTTCGLQVGNETNMVRQSPTPPIIIDVPPIGLNPFGPPLTIVTTSGPSIVHSKMQSPTNSGPTYYVTEPTDSPTSQFSPQSSLSNHPSLPNWCDTPSLSPKPYDMPLCMEIPEVPEVLVSSAFNGLSLKRKAHEDSSLLPHPSKVSDVGAQAYV
ncbi:hypothetical protein LOK49_LG02G02641 [Camellia lanceoleosa]|uniref:Uncharacterized protein n=1 Tax=Camellia lanceoleosa TaxID=1840588 RepID=A0ACC0ISL4_9ERIC|nr:hypothetical protein LOK49_LG02G02641 [Camellia lanceoleosa]